MKKERGQDMKTTYHNQQLIDKSKCKCLADQVLLYIRYACPKLSKSTEFQEYAERIYTEYVRGEIIGNPRIKAAGIVYIAAVMTKTYVSQIDIAEVFRIAETSVRASYVEIKQKHG